MGSRTGRHGRLSRWAFVRARLCTFFFFFSAPLLFFFPPWRCAGPCVPRRFRSTQTNKFTNDRAAPETVPPPRPLRPPCALSGCGPAEEKGPSLGRPESHVAESYETSRNVRSRARPPPRAGGAQYCVYTVIIVISATRQ